MKKLLIASLLSSLVVAPCAFAEELAPAMTMQIVQDQFILDATTISNAIIVEPDHHYQGVHLELTPLAARKLAAMTSESVGKKINIILNDKVVSTNIIKSTIDNHVLITGMSYDEAQHFVNAIREIHAKPVKKPAVAMANAFENLKEASAAKAAEPVEPIPSGEAVASNDVTIVKDDPFEVAAGLNATGKEEVPAVPSSDADSQQPAMGPQMAQNDETSAAEELNEKDFIVQD